MSRHNKPMTFRIRLAVVACLAAGLSLPSVRAQNSAAEDPHAGHGMAPTAAPTSNPDTNAGAEAVPPQNAAKLDWQAMQGGRPPPDARDPHAYSGGRDFGPLKLELADTRSFGQILVENLEVLRSNGATSAPYDVQAWYGRTYDRVVFKSEGEIATGEIRESRNELMWGRAVSSFWDAQLGVRYDSGVGPNRRWLAFGIQGLAPYWFEVEATAYVGESGRSALRFDTSYDLLLTQKLILQPRIEANLYGQRDVQRGLGSGLSDVSAGLRLRYQIRRELAPYLGIEWLRKYGETEDLVRSMGADANDTRIVAGFRFWF